MNLIKTFAAAAAMTLVGSVASAATLTLTGTGGDAVLLGTDFDLTIQTGLGVGTLVAVYDADDTGGLELSGQSKVDYTYLGEHAGHENGAFEATAGTLFTASGSTFGDTTSVIDDGGIVDFSFQDITDGETIANGDFANADAGLSIAFYQVDANTYIALFGDGSGNQDNDDFAIRISAVPLPAGAVLLLSGLGGFAALRRRKKA